jgi:hypothetical protein
MSGIGLGPDGEARCATERLRSRVLSAVSNEALTLLIDESGRIVVEGRSAVRRLAARPGRYRLLPSPGNLVLLERIEQAAGDGRTALSGEVERVGGLIDILHFVFDAGWSGQLTVVDGSVRKTLFLRRGDVRTAASNVPEDRIGAILYRFGRISAAQLEAALLQVTQEHRFGQILVENGTLTQHDLYQFVRKQVEEIFYSVLVMRRGDFYFYRTGDDEVPPSQLQLSTKQLLFEGVRRIDEMSYFREKLPGSDVVLVRRQPPPDEKLPPREARVLALVDGVRDLAAIARESHLGEFDTTRILFQLLHADWVAVRARPSSSSTSISPPPDDATLRRVVESFNEAYARVYKLVEVAGRAIALLKAVDSFFQSAAEFAPLFVGVMLDDDGRIAPDQVLANLHIAPTDNRAEYLSRGLRELLFFELFSAGEAVDRDEERELHAKLSQILKDLKELPARSAAGAR